MNMKSKSLPPRTLGPVSAEFINKLLRRSKVIFTLDDAVDTYGRDKHQTGKFLSALIKRNVIVRIKAAVYLILLAGQENIQLSTWPVIARELAGGSDYYISHYSAMRLHGMTTHSLVDVYITMSKRRKVKVINNITYHFIYAKPEHAGGRVTYWVNNQDKILISDLERTLLEGFDRPDLSGGIKEVVRGLWVKQKVIDWKKISEYATKFHNRAAVKRLGFILELLGLADGDILLLLTSLIASTTDYVLLDPNGSREGQYLSRWGLRINMNTDELKASVWE
ncbi:MAG: type IV toxin-antitoxin system AbiEi family antitoxin domain-containing protein [Gammaproteobacteria bacterium]